MNYICEANNKAPYASDLHTSSEPITSCNPLSARAPHARAPQRAPQRSQRRAQAGFLWVAAKILLVCLLWLWPQISLAQTNYISSESALLVDANQRSVLYAHNPYQQLHPASITKVMTAYITYDLMHQGVIHGTDMIPVSARAASIGGSSLFLKEGEAFPLDTLISGMIIASGNDASIAIAEYISGSEDEFVLLMNEYAYEMGMYDTNFSNSHGKIIKNHYSTAWDIYLLGQNLIDDFYDEYLKTFWHQYFKLDEDRKFETLNPTIRRGYQGVDGIKMGYTYLTRYQLAASAMRGNTRLILVLLGNYSYKDLDEDAVTLLNYGFDTIAADDNNY